MLIMELCTIVLLIALGRKVNGAEDMEPAQCFSRFDYDYKIMQKLQELETKMTSIEDDTCVRRNTNASFFYSNAEKRQVFFMAELSNDMVNPPPEKTVVFDKVHTHSAAGYNHNTGIFSAPFDGLYTFSVVASSQPKDPGNWLHLYVMKNYAQIGYIFLDGNNDRWLQRSSSVLTKLDAGDQVTVKIGRTKGSGTLGGCCFHTVFSGFLIQPN